MDAVSTTPKRSASKTLGLVMVMGLLALVVIVDSKRRAVQAQLEQVTMRLEEVTGGTPGNTEENKAAAKKIVEQASKIIAIDTSVEPTVAQIIDVTKLQDQSPFYANAKNGMYLIVTQSTAYIYDPEANKIINVAPVEIRPPSAEDEAAASSAAAAQQKQPAAATSSAPAAAASASVQAAQ